MQRVTTLVPAAATQASVLTTELNGVRQREAARHARKEMASRPRSQWQPVEKVVVDVVTLSADEHHDGYELRFPPKEKVEMPEYPALVSLFNQNGWRFYKMKDGKFDPRWCHKRTPEALGFAKSVVQMFKGACEV